MEPAVPVLGYYQATYDFQAENDAEVSLKVGDLVAVYEMADDDWWRGELTDGRSGLFPANHVVQYVEEDVADEEQVQLESVEQVQAAPAVAPYINGSAVVSNGPAGNGIPRNDTAVLQTMGMMAGPQSPTYRKSNAQPLESKSAPPQSDAIANKSQAPKPKKPKTYFGKWSSQMALISGVFALMLGFMDLIWGGLDEDRGVVYILCGLYTMIVGAGTIYYELNWGQARSPNKTPWRGIAYLLLSIFMFFAVPSVFAAYNYVFVSAVNFYAAQEGESYDAPKAKRKTDLKDADLKPLGPDKDVFSAAWNWILLQKERSTTGVIVFMSLYVAANIIVWCTALAVWVGKNNDFAPNDRLSGWGPLAKAFGNVLDLNCAILVLPVCRTFIRLLYNYSTGDQSCSARALRAVLKYVPLDRNLDFHILVAKVMAFSAIGHTVMHLFNYIKSPEPTMRKFGVWPWVSGAFIFVCMLFIFSAAAPTVKSGQFEIFWYNHHFFVFFYIFLLLHGNGGFNPNFWKWFIGPGLLYAAERLARYYRSKQQVVLLSVTNMKPNVIALEFAKNQGGFWSQPYKDGQYVFIKCPYLSVLEWHPFTISSAPEEDTVTVHIRKMERGSWTAQLADYLTSFGQSKASRFELSRLGPGGTTLRGKVVGPDGNPLIQCDGPHSAPTQHVTEYHTVMVVGGGIGVTPVAATLKSVVLHRWRMGIGRCFPDNAYFYWVCSQRDLDSFRWFVYSIKECADDMYDMRAKMAKSMNQKRFEFHFYITSMKKDTTPAMLQIPAEDDMYSFWGQYKQEDKGVQQLSKEAAPFEALTLYSFLRCPDARLWVSPQYSHLIPQQGVYIPDDNSYIQLGHDLFIWNGRPKWDEQFRAVSASHTRNKTIGVTFCGNPYIASDLQSMCQKHSSIEDQRFFVMHKENF